MLMSLLWTMLLLVGTVSMWGCAALEGSQIEPDRIVAYKQTPQGELTIHWFFPPDWKPTDRRAAIVFYHGGGFRAGAPGQFYKNSKYLAEHGMIAASAEYRLRERHDAPPNLCVEDARSAMRYVRSHAEEYGIDPQKILAGGGSAGGYLACSLTYGSGPDAEGEDTSIPLRPAALVLYNPAFVDLTDRLTGEEEENRIVEAAISPIKNLHAGGPPSIHFFGTEDRLLAPARQWCERAIALGSACEMWLAEGQKHAFFNKSPWREATLEKTHEWLASLGYLSGPPTVDVPEPAPMERAEFQP